MMIMILHLLLRSVLKRWVFLCLLLPNPSLALEEFSKKPSDYELVISDIRMPNMNGYEFVKQVKKINPKVNVILMTAFEIEDKEFHSILPSIKINGFLQKPFSIAQLNDIIRKIR